MTKKIGFLTIDQIAGQMGVHRATVYQWVNKGCPRGPIEEVQDWYDANIQSQPEASELGEELKRAELAKLLEEARYKRIKSDQAEGLLVAVEEVEADIRAAGNILRNTLKSLGAEVANMIPSEQKGIVKKKVEKKVALAMERFAEALRERSSRPIGGFGRLPDGDDDGGLDEP